MTVSRRDMLKLQAAGVAALAANVALPAAAQPVEGGIESLQIKWSKAPCRFCGTGCGVMVGVKEGRVVATHGDTLAEVNRGLNCVKGYFLSKIMYGADRLTQPLLRKAGGAYAKDGAFTPVTWDEAFDVMAEQAKRVLRVAVQRDNSCDRRQKDDERRGLADGEEPRIAGADEHPIERERPACDRQEQSQHQQDVRELVLHTGIGREEKR